MSKLIKNKTLLYPVEALDQQNLKKIILLLWVEQLVSCVNESTEVCGGPVVRKMVLLSSRGSGSTKPQKNYTTTVRGAVSCVNESTEVCGGPVVPKDGAINQ